ncbi:ribonuclease III [Cryphonectria parasitica EP155]|uniref:Large ribosomal subunit protein mL44 n=1 Tax=Cryphonectria parasitica (strain ATCC 38755 / EP155) TaxID=660469 RepID=A0A9P4Y735_CRYP1|nr:ribonuclease III [Cryphonectria parasitica EP155]KAF3767562.1 ribonuclease III [Cryphonectria parasitica EP155]
MKRLRLEKWSGHLLSARPGAATTCSRSTGTPPLSSEAQDPQSSPIATTSSAEPTQWPPIDPDQYLGEPPSPLPNKALRSAKLAALHARLALSDKIPLQTLARTLVDPSADAAPLFNNSNLSFLGQTLISYYTSEMLMCRYPRLPMEIMHAAMKAYAGDKTLFYVSRSWGVENAAAPGVEVDPGLLQFSLDAPRAFNTKWGFVRSEYQHKYRYRRGISSRVVMDDDFGEFVRAVVGAIYTHSGREAARSFVKAHILSRQLDLERLFTFKLPLRELARLCMREEFEQPVARLLSETGRLSRTPVFVVGIFSGNDKLGEGTAASLDHARKKAAMNALKAWYLYSPGEDVRVPSDMMLEGAKPWEPVYVDIGEVITSGI